MLTKNDITHSSIFSANPDGSQPKLLLSRNSTGFVGLTIDMKNETLFFYDISLYSIYSIAFNGKDILLIYQISKELNIQIENFDLLYKKIYFNDMKMIYSVDIDKRYKPQNVNLTTPEILQMPKFRIINKSRQPDLSSLCSDANCSQICLPINKTNYRCVCSAKNYLCDSNVSFVKINDLLYQNL